MNRPAESRDVLRERSCPWWFKARPVTAKDAKVHEETPPHTLLRWLKFNFVGLIGIGVQMTALAVFRSSMHFDYLVATALAVEVAVLHNFLWHERFTWVDRPAGRPLQSLVRLLKFNLTNGAVSLVGNLLLMRLLVGQFRINYFVANLGAIALCSLANFLLGDHIVFRNNTIGA